MSFQSQSVFCLQFFKIILSVSNWSFVSLDFLWNPFCASDNKLSPYICSYSLSLSILVIFFHVRGNHVIGLKLVKSFPFSLFFFLSTVLLILNKAGVLFISTIIDKIFEINSSFCVK